MSCRLPRLMHCDTLVERSNHYWNAKQQPHMLSMDQSSRTIYATTSYWKSIHNRIIYIYIEREASVMNTVGASAHTPEHRTPKYGSTSNT